MLYLIRSGTGPRYVVWRPHTGAYYWYGEPDHGARVGTTAEQAAEYIGRTLGLSAP
ncbi:hypothetical protein [Actinomadura roseirufa]|uniref:hypothetical protein n=1 Tax=Actinomadura roseirufa TaxID=2094049 RepID=UPI0013F1624B|nr:hypothetical protein [Actinomadura roseirufa]